MISLQKVVCRCFEYICPPYCLPCACYLTRCRGRRYCKKHRHRSTPVPTLPPFLPPQSRRLSIGEEKSTSSSKSLSSPLFKLPSEIRRQVYEYVLGNNVIHLRLRRNRTGERQQLHLRYTNCQYRHDHPVLPSTMTWCCERYEERSKGFLPLLRTCRRV